MEDLGFSCEETVDVFKIVAATLKLGNINFVPITNMDGTEGCTINNEYGKIMLSIGNTEDSKCKKCQPKND